MSGLAGEIDLTPPRVESPADVMAATGGDAGGAAMPADVGSPAASVYDPAAATIQAGGTDPFDITAPTPGGDFMSNTFGTDDPFASDYSTNLSSVGPDIQGPPYEPDITQAPEDYSWMQDPNALQPEPGAVDVRQASPYQNTGDTWNADSSTPKDSSFWDTLKGAWSDVSNAPWGSALKDVGIGMGLGAPILEYFGYKKNQKDLNNMINNINTNVSNPLEGEGQKLMDLYNKGQLPPGQQAVIDQWLQSTKAQAKQAYINAGMADSSAELAAEAYAGQTAAGMTATDFQTLLNQAQSLIQGGGTAQQNALNAQLQGDQQLAQLLQNFMSSYGNVLRGLS